MPPSLRKLFGESLRAALEWTPWSGRRDQARRARRARQDLAAGPAKDAFVVALPDLTGRGLRPVFLERRSRYATVTSVKLLDPETLVCASFLEKTLYLVRFDAARRTHRILDAVPTRWRGVPVETDLADADPATGDVVLSNFHHGSAGHFRREGDRLRFVGDLDLGLGDGPGGAPSKVHGLKLVGRDRLAVTVGSAPTGVRFFDLTRGKPTVHVELARKTQDVAFLGETEMIVLAVHGAPRRQRQSDYGSDVCRIAFDPTTGRAEIVAQRTFADTHFDACVLDGGRILLTDQRNDCVRVLDPASLEVQGDVVGYAFPHGIDVRFGWLAVSNYGANTIDLRRMDALELRRQTRPAQSALRRRRPAIDVGPVRRADARPRARP